MATDHAGYLYFISRYFAMLAQLCSSALYEQVCILPCSKHRCTEFLYAQDTTKRIRESETTNSDLQHTWGVPLPVTLGLEVKSIRVLELNHGVHITKQERNLDLLQVLVCKLPFSQSPRLMNFQVAPPDLNCALYKAPPVC